MIDFGASRVVPRSPASHERRGSARHRMALDTGEQRVYLFIYRVRQRTRPPEIEESRHCTVLVLGRSADAAERIAINCVHQHGFHILKTDTATVLSRGALEDGDDCAIYRSDLRAFGAAFRLLARG